MSSKTERLDILSEGGPFAQRSLSQENISNALDGQKKFSGTDRKAAKSQARRARQEQFEKNLPKFQFDRALGHLFNGGAGGVTREDLRYILKNIHRHERRIGGFSTEKAKVVISIIDLTRP